ncbi:MAG: ABC transporter substrate-binding protein [Pseudomonadota bacterium]
MGKSKTAISVLLLAMALMTACASYEDLAKERARRAKKATGDIHIALVWQEKLGKTFFFEGAEFAAEEINRSGGINGRKVRTIRYYNDSGTLKRDRQLAKTIAANRDIVAVVGHFMDIGAIEASVTYEYCGVILISPAATAVGYTRHGFQFAFRNTPSDSVNGVELADLVKKLGYLKVLVIDDRMVYGKGLADIFYERASKIGINVVARRSYDSMEKDFKPLFAEIKKLRFDAIFLGGEGSTAGEVIKQARIMGVKAPFIGGNSLDIPAVWEIAGKAAEGTITPTVFHYKDKRDASRAFTDRFHARHQAFPDTWAALGYDAIQVLAGAFQKTGTTVPVIVASHLRFLRDWQGVIGTYSFTRDGDVSGEINEFQVLHNGKYEMLEGGSP